MVGITFCYILYCEFVFILWQSYSKYLAIWPSQTFFDIVKLATIIILSNFWNFYFNPPNSLIIALISLINDFNHFSVDQSGFLNVCSNLPSKKFRTLVAINQSANSCLIFSFSTPSRKNLFKKEIKFAGICKTVFFSKLFLNSGVNEQFGVILINEQEFVDNISEISFTGMTLQVFRPIILILSIMQWV